MAGNSLTDGGFWLPSEFLTDEDVLVGKENFDKNGLNSKNNPCFPTEFPYGFGSFDSLSLFQNSPVESVTESESDEDDFLTGLTRQFARSILQETHKVPYAPSRNLEKTWVLSGSPQSTLSPVFSNGSPNGPSLGPSPPTSPSGENGDAWNLICAAAGQVNMLKMKNEVLIKSGGLLAPTHKFSPLYLPNPTTGLYNTNFQQVKQVGGPIWGQQQAYQNRGPRICVENGGGPVGNGRCGRALGLPESAWPTLQIQKQQFYQNPQQNGGGGGVRAVFPGSGSGGGRGGAKRECAGTGVFLPRRYEAPFDSRVKSGCSTAILPAGVVQALNKRFDTMTTQSQTQAQPHFNGSLFPEYDVLMARRNAPLAQQRRNSMWAEGAMNYEIRLPQEWTY